MVNHTFVYCMHSANECDHVPSLRHTGGLASSGNGNTYPAKHVIFNLSPGAYQNFSGIMRPLDGSPGYSHLALPVMKHIHWPNINNYMIMEKEENANVCKKKKKKMPLISVIVNVAIWHINMHFGSGRV